MSTNSPYGQPNNPPGQYPAHPYHQPPSRNNSGLVIAAIIAAVVAVPVLIACAGILVGLLLPAVQASREAARRMQCSNNLKQIGLAMHNYHSTYGSFPPAYTMDDSGRRLHSWRTLILPYIEQQALYDQIDLDKPWDDPANLQAAAVAIPAYECPSTPGGQPATTTYVAVVDPSGVFSGSQGTTFSNIPDGLSNTVLVVETSPSNAVPWMSPQDISMNTFLATGSQPTAHAGGAQVVMSDGAVKFLSNNMQQGLRQAIVTKDGGEDAGGL